MICERDHRDQNTADCGNRPKLYSACGEGQTKRVLNLASVHFLKTPGPLFDKEAVHAAKCTPYVKIRWLQPHLRQSYYGWMSVRLCDINAHI